MLYLFVRSYNVIIQVMCINLDDKWLINKLWIKFYLKHLIQFPVFILDIYKIIILIIETSPCSSHDSSSQLTSLTAVSLHSSLSSPHGPASPRRGWISFWTFFLTTFTSDLMGERNCFPEIFFCQGLLFKMLNKSN